MKHIKKNIIHLKKFLLLKDGILSNNIIISLEKLIKYSGNKYENSEWGFKRS